MTHSISITLTHDEALVLTELLDRFARTGILSLVHNAEFLALSKISAQLDKALVEPFNARYGELVDQARERLAADFEGRAPGVTGGEA